MNSSPPRYASARILKTIVLLLFVWTVAWMALSESDAATQAKDPATPAPAAGDANAPSTGTSGDADAQLYLQKCAGCHTIGRGKLTGPDLNASATWPKEDLARAIKSMEKNVGPLAPEAIEQLVQLLKAPDVKDRLAAEEGRAAKALEAKFDPPSPSTGEALFTGRRAFANGGMACAACHTVTGYKSALGPDLKDVHTRLGEAPLRSACEKTSFKVMSAAYRDHPVTKQEAIHLTAYFASIVGAPPPAPLPPVGAYGAAGGAVVMAGIWFALRNRAAGMRQRLVRRRRQ